MRPICQDDILEIFCDALEVKDPIQRRAFLDRACGHNSNARARIEALLAAQPNVELFFTKTALELKWTDL